jgi:hypothetical protein
MVPKHPDYMLNTWCSRAKLDRQGLGNLQSHLTSIDLDFPKSVKRRRRAWVAPEAHAPIEEVSHTKVPNGA